MEEFLPEIDLPPGLQTGAWGIYADGEDLFDIDETSVHSSLLSITSLTYSLTIELQPAPVPPAAWLFGSVLLGLVGVARRKKA